MSGRGRRPQDPAAGKMIGRTFGRLTVESRVGRDRWRAVLWRCRCRCGEFTTVRAHALRTHDIQSCGCLRRELGDRNLHGWRFSMRREGTGAA